MYWMRPVKVLPSMYFPVKKTASENISIERLTSEDDISPIIRTG